MIEVIIRLKGSKEEIGYIEIENISPEKVSTGDYVVKMGVEKITGVGIHVRGFTDFPRKKYNVLALIRQALATLEEEELLIGADPDGNHVLRKTLPRTE